MNSFSYIQLLKYLWNTKHKLYKISDCIISPKYALFNTMRQLILIYMLFKFTHRNR